MAHYSRDTVLKRCGFCLLFGIPSSIGYGLLYAFFVYIFRLKFSFIYPFMGFTLGKLVSIFNDNKHKIFPWVGCILSLLCVITCDLLTFNTALIFLMPETWLNAIEFLIRYWLRAETFKDIKLFCGLSFRILTIVFGYIFSRKSQ